MKNLLYLYIFLISLTVFSQEKKANLSYRKQVYSLDTLSINSKESDFGVSYINQDEVVFSSPERDKFFLRKWFGNQQGYLELYQGKLQKNGSVKDVELYSSVINSKYHESNIVITKDGKNVYFTSNSQKNGKRVKGENGFTNLQLYKADLIEGKFTNVRLLPFNDVNFSTGHPTLSLDGKTLYFISDRPGGFGSADVYKVAILGEDRYGEVENLGGKINSVSKEMFPFIDSDGVLYFSSDRLGTTGGLDVYGISLLDAEDTLYQLPAPINSEQDDFAFILGNNKQGFLSSNREGGKGDDDIYRLQMEMCFQTMLGKVLNVKDGSAISGAVVSLYQGEKLLESITTKEDGSFNVKKSIFCDEKYFIKATKENFKNDSLNIETPSLKSYENIVTLNLEPYIDIVENKIYIEPIYFDFDKYNIRPDAAKILDKVVETMKKYPSLIVEGGSHTDSRASFKYNETLSANRAKSTVDYIISKGISSDRISSKGYGETQLTNKCSDGVKCTEEAHQLNRRTEFKIVSQ